MAVQAERERLAQLDATQLRLRAARSKIDEILTLKCPRCRGAFAMQVAPLRT